ncbi:MAG: hypothetical protein IMZ66_04440 [Planctomycetes bacterium]|nr:hypothetical protein [Planctomycetota bacterium]
MLADLVTAVALQAAPAQEASPFWWTFLAQVANFLILVAVLRWVLYKRVLRVMDQRERKIASHFEAAEQKEAEATASAADLARQQQEFGQQRASLLEEAAADAGRRRDELVAKARDEASGLAARWREDLERSREAFLDEMRRRAGRQVCEAARRALRDLADAELEARMVDVLIRRLADVPEDERGPFVAAARDAGGTVVAATALELASPQRDRLSAAVREVLGPDLTVSFEQAPELSCGIELRAAGREISWTADGYVQGLCDALGEAIDAQMTGGPAAAPAGAPAAAEASKAAPAPASDAPAADKPAAASGEGATRE